MDGVCCTEHVECQECSVDVAVAVSQSRSREAIRSQHISIQFSYALYHVLALCALSQAVFEHQNVFDSLALADVTTHSVKPLE